ncbi:DNA polymerase IV [Leuconostocaceae bacterium ESL0958]|nr:DNA polymerase IV [Leuconostocaceae bacterium ESL0958]
MAAFLEAKDERKILHVDLDAFYAQVEMRDNPALKKVPLLIGRDPAFHHGHGVVATANYRARQLGVHSAMGAIEAKKLAPNAVFVAPDFPKYRSISAQIHEIFAEFTTVIEPVALDEAYLDVTAHPLSAPAIAAQLRQRIFQETALTCSVGVSYNKVLAKLGSEHHKPNGVTVIGPAVAERFLAQLPIAEFRGVGKKAQEKLTAMGVATGADLRKISQDDLRAAFGSFGDQLYWQARGTHFGQVKDHRVRQSVGKENTFELPLRDRAAVAAAFKDVAEKVVAVMKDKGFLGRTLTVKVRDDHYQTATRSITQRTYFALEPDFLARQAQPIFDDLYPEDDFAIRLLGLTFSNVSDQASQPISLFENEN